MRAAPIRRLDRASIFWPVDAPRLQKHSHRRCPMTFDEKIILTCIGLGIGLLFFVLSYLNERKSLEEVCTYLHQQVLVLPEGATSLEAPYGLDRAYKRCQTSKAIRAA